MLTRRLQAGQVPKNEMVLWAAVGALAVICGVWAGLHATEERMLVGLSIGWWQGLRDCAAMVGWTFWIFITVLPLLLVTGLIAADRALLKMFTVCAPLTGSLGTVCGLMGALGSLDTGSVQGIKSCIPHLVVVFGSTALGVIYALAGFFLALLAGINVFADDKDDE